jgi:hypothetical protein
VHTIYNADEHEDEIRVDLHDNCDNLVKKYLDAGQTLIFIMGVGGKFRDIYFQRNNSDNSYIMNEWVYLFA